MDKTLHLLTFVLAILTGICMLIGFLVRDGNRIIKDHLANWWTYIEDGDWSSFTISVAHVTDAVFDSFLGRELISVRAFAIWLGICLMYAILLYQLDLVFHILVGKNELNTSQFQSVNALGLAGLFAFYIIDFTALAYTRHLLRFLTSTSTSRDVRAFIFRTFLVIYISFGTLLFFITSYEMFFIDCNTYCKLLSKIHGLFLHGLGAIVQHF